MIRMRSSEIFYGFTALIALLTQSACSETAEARYASAQESTNLPVTPTIEFDSLFVLERVIQLEEPDSALITEIVSLDVDACGRLLLPDPTSGQVRLFGPTGELLRVLGRQGKGPGEFTQPMGAAFGADGSIYVSEVGNPRITRFDSAFQLDTIFPLHGAAFGSNIAAVGNEIVIFAMRAAKNAELYALYTSNGELNTRFHAFPAAIRETPYWISTARSRLATGANSVFVAANLLYPIRRYSTSGATLDPLGTPPPSWKQASRLKAGAFVGPKARAEFQKWRRSFTTIAALGVYRDSLLLVVHAELDPEVLAYEKATYRADIYTLSSPPQKIYRDVRFPGPMLHAGRAVHLLLSKPDVEHGWTLGRFRLAEGAVR